MAPSAPLRHVTVIMHISAGFYLFFPFLIFSPISDFISAAFFFFFQTFTLQPHHFSKWPECKLVDLEQTLMSWFISDTLVETKWRFSTPQKQFCGGKKTRCRSLLFAWIRNSPGERAPVACHATDTLHVMFNMISWLPRIVLHLLIFTIWGGWLCEWTETWKIKRLKKIKKIKIYIENKLKELKEIMRTKVRPLKSENGKSTPIVRVESR